ncbi:MAG TPA: hypothetical protein VHY59_07995, partial [Chthoniobacterales bacterium]|nr:hypothetical protein [Chthoniobacterales bacterium]
TIGLFRDRVASSMRILIDANRSVTTRRIQNLNALFGVAYRESRRFSVPQLGYLGYRITCNSIIHDWLHRLQRGNSPLQKATDPSQDQNGAGIN